MVEIYAQLIIKGLKKIDDVPKHIRSRVKARLEEIESNA